MITQLLPRPLLGTLVGGLLGESVGFVPPPPPPPPEVPQGVITFPAPTVTDTTISQPFSYSASDFTGFYYKVNGGAQSSAASPINLSSLTPETNYTIAVAAYNVTGTGTWYETVVQTEAEEPPPPPPPEVPDGITTITVTDPAQETVDVTFTYTFGDNGLDYLGFEYQLNSGLWQSAPASPGTFTISGLVQSTSYSLLMRAYNAVGSGAVSAVANFDTLAPPPPDPTTRWQYTFDAVDDRLVFPKLFDRSYTGVYKLKFELFGTIPATQRSIVHQGSTNAIGNSDLYIGRTTSNSTWDLIFWGISLTARSFSGGVTFGPGVWEFTMDMTSGLQTISKDGVLGGSVVRTFGSANTGTQTVFMARQATATPTYDRHQGGGIKNIKLYKDDVLEFECLVDRKDEATQVSAPTTYNGTLQNQNTANWTEVPL